jgi:hypothetical protein
MTLATLTRETPGRARLDAALDRLQPPREPSRLEEAIDYLENEISRLRLLQRAHERREEQRRQERAGRAEFTAERSRRAAAHMAQRGLMLNGVDRAWFVQRMQQTLDGLRGADAERLGKALEEVMRRDELWREKR